MVHTSSKGTGSLTPSQVMMNGSIDLVAGSLGGCASVLVGQPLDTIKVKMQTFPHLYKGTWTCLKKTLSQDGIRRGLYAGTLPAIAANVAENSVLFCGYGMCQNLVVRVRHGPASDRDPSTLDKAMAGFCAAFFSSFTLCPTELIKCKLQAMRESSGASSSSSSSSCSMSHPLGTTASTMNPLHPQSSTSAASSASFHVKPSHSLRPIGALALTGQILKKEGIPGMFRGLTSTMMREMPGYFFFFGGYELTRSYWTNGKPEEATLFHTIVSGGVGGMCLWISIFPFDVAKSRIQVDSLKDPMVSVMRNIIRKEGIMGLYRGLTPTLIRTFPSTGALFVAYEQSRYFMSQTAHGFNLL